MKDINSEEADNIRRNFDNAVRLVKSLPQKGSFQPSYAEAAKIYSYFKQSKFGRCNIPKPGFWDYINRAKWDAWAALEDMPQLDAMENYVNEIKNIYIRVKDLPEFQENEHQYEDILIPFCQANDIEMSPKLNEILKKKSPTKENGTALLVNGNTNAMMYPVMNQQENENLITNGDDGDDNIVSQQETLESMNHSMLVENSMPTKMVSFKVNGKNNSNEDNKTDQEDDDNDDDEEEIYCDPIDPESILGNGESTLFEITNLSESSSANVNNDTSTPDLKINKTSSSTSTNSDGFEVLPNLNGDHRKHVCSSLTKEFRRSHRKQEKQVSARKGVHRAHGNAHHGPRAHKRLDQQTENSQHSQTSNNRNGVSSHSSNVPSNQHQQHPSNVLPHSNTAGGSDDNEDDSFSTTSSIDSDTIGLRIVNALERMEESMCHVLDRLDSIDESIKSITKPTTPWWKEYVPSRSIVFWGTWPILVNFLFFLYWRRITRQKLKKC